MSRRVFFTHVMRTGGTSLLAVLAQHFEPDVVYPNGSTAPLLFEKVTIDTLMRLDAARRASFRLFSVHMPAWVAEEVAPDALRVSVLREPVARTVSHLRQMARQAEGERADLERLYRDPELRFRLANYQTRIFSLTRRDWEDENRRVAEVAARISAGPVSDADRRALEEGIRPYVATGIPRAAPVGDEQLAAARERLRDFDVIGTTESLAPTVERLRDALDIDLQLPHQENAATDSFRPSASLLDMIRADNQLDAALYGLARDLAR